MILVNNNDAYSQVIAECKNASLGKLEGRHADLWKFTQVNFAALAEAIGCKGIRVTKPSQLQGALEQAFAADKPCVVEVLTDVSVVAPLASASPAT